MLNLIKQHVHKHIYVFVHLACHIFTDLLLVKHKTKSADEPQIVMRHLQLHLPIQHDEYFLLCSDHFVPWHVTLPANQGLQGAQFGQVLITFSVFGSHESACQTDEQVLFSAATLRDDRAMAWSTHSTVALCVAVWIPLGSVEWIRSCNIIILIVPIDDSVEHEVHVPNSTMDCVTTQLAPIA